MNEKEKLAAFRALQQAYGELKSPQSRLLNCLDVQNGAKGV